MGSLQFYQPTPGRIYSPESQSFGEFIDPQSGAHTQTVEGQWHLVNEKFKRNFGTSNNTYKTYFPEFIWCKKFGSPNEVFFLFLDTCCDVLSLQIIFCVICNSFFCISFIKIYILRIRVKKEKGKDGLGRNNEMGGGDSHAVVPNLFLGAKGQPFSKVNL